jgi:hypothetical protein
MPLGKVLFMLISCVNNLIFNGYMPACRSPAFRHAGMEWQGIIIPLGAAYLGGPFHGLMGWWLARLTAEKGTGFRHSQSLNKKTTAGQLFTMAIIFSKSCIQTQTRKILLRGQA